MTQRRRRKSPREKTAWDVLEPYLAEDADKEEEINLCQKVIWLGASLACLQSIVYMHEVEPRSLFIAFHLERIHWLRFSGGLQRQSREWRERQAQHGICRRLYGTWRWCLFVGLGKVQV